MNKSITAIALAIAAAGGLALLLKGSAPTLENPQKPPLVNQDPTEGEAPRRALAQVDDLHAVVTVEQARSKILIGEPGIDEDLRNFDSEVVKEIIESLPDSWFFTIPEHAIAEGESIQGIPNGIWTIAYPEKGLIDSGNFVLGAKFGDWLVHDEGGNLIQQRTYNAGKLEGVWRYRDSSTDDWLEFYYVNGKRVD